MSDNNSATMGDRMAMIRKHSQIGQEVFADIRKTVELVEEFINLNDLTPTLDQKKRVTSVIFEAITEQPNLSKHLIQSMMQSILVKGEA